MTAARTRFLHRRSYRRRRIADAARLLPLAGLILLLIPMLLPSGVGLPAPARTSAVGIYIFGVWVGLIVLSFGLSRGLRDDGDPETTAPSEDETTGNGEIR